MAFPYSVGAKTRQSCFDQPQLGTCAIKDFAAMYRITKDHERAMLFINHYV